MARTRLFDVLRSWAGNYQRTCRPEAGAHVAGVFTRRQFGVGGIGLLGCAQACGQPLQNPVVPGVQTASGARRSLQIAVVGAGIAGLHAAYRLTQAGVRVEVFDAASRVGGRLFTGRGLFPNEQICELGGELIDSNHRYVFALCKELGLVLDDRLHGVPPGYVNDTWYVAGRVVTEADLAEQFASVVAELAADVKAADSDAKAFETLNHTSLGDYLERVVPKAVYPELHAVLCAAYVGEFGLEVNEQSALNLVYLIGTEAETGFRIFGDSDERYHVHGGNDLLASKLASKLAAPVHVGHKLMRAAGVEGDFELEFEQASGKRVLTRSTHLVLALPFTLLRRVNIDSLPLSQTKRQIIQELGYGSNAKLMGAFQSPVWRTQYQASGSVTCDTELQQTWDSTPGQAGSTAVLTNFLGGKQGVLSGSGTAEAWLVKQLPYLDQVYPGAAKEYLPGSATRMHWPTVPTALGSYTCYRPGQWSFRGKSGLPEAGVHFCGEHTSAEFQGWIEGAAETGARVAREILQDCALPVPAGWGSLPPVEQGAVSGVR